MIQHAFNKDRTKLFILRGTDDLDFLRSCKDIYEALEDFTCNSEFKWVYPDQTGDLADAEMLGIYDIKDDDENKIIERWAFMEYEGLDPLQTLIENGKLIMVGGRL